MTIPERKIEISPLGGLVTRDGHTVTVHIYRFADSDDEWILEVENQKGDRTVWKESFDTDQDAVDAFDKVVEEDGMWSFSAVKELRH